MILSVEVVGWLDGRVNLILGVEIHKSSNIKMNLCPLYALMFLLFFLIIFRAKRDINLKYISFVIAVVIAV